MVRILSVRVRFVTSQITDKKEKITFFFNVYQATCVSVETE